MNNNHFLSKIPFFLVFFSFQQSSNLYSTIISLPLLPYPFSKEASTEQLKGLLSQTGKRAVRILLSQQAIKRTQGIVATYNGYINFSDQNGQIVFPRTQSKDTLRILITERILPVIMFGNTIHHWQRQTGLAAELYTLSYILNKHTNNFEWLVEKNVLPMPNRIELDTLVLLGKPDSFYVPTGTITTDENSNLLLPPIYVKKDINNTVSNLWSIKIRQFFKPLIKNYKKITDVYYSEQILY